MLLIWLSLFLRFVLRYFFFIVWIVCWCKNGYCGWMFLKYVWDSSVILLVDGNLDMSFVFDFVWEIVLSLFLIFFVWLWIELLVLCFGKFMILFVILEKERVDDGLKYWGFWLVVLRYKSVILLFSMFVVGVFGLVEWVLLCVLIGCLLISFWFCRWL